MARMEAMKMECKGFHVRITRDAFEKVRGFVNLCPTEVGGIMKGKLQEDGILLYDPFLFEQVVTSVTTELDTDSVFKAVMSAAESGQDTTDWMSWFHSHVNMTARFSGKDVDTIRLLAAETPLVSIVMNKSGEYECRVDFYKPFRMVLHDVELEIVYEPNEELIASVKKELADKVKTTRLSGLAHRVRNGGGEGDFAPQGSFFPTEAEEQEGPIMAAARKEDEYRRGTEESRRRMKQGFWPGGIGKGGVLQVRSDRENQD